MSADAELRAGRIAGELADEFPDLALTYMRVDAPPRGFRSRSTPAVKDRLRGLSNRFTGGRAVNFRKEEVPAAYRIFSRQIGLDPDTHPTPPEELLLRRMRLGEFHSKNKLVDALMVGMAETSVALTAFDGAALDGRPGLRLAGSNETLGGREQDFPLIDRQIVIADDRRALGVLFGMLAEGLEPTKESESALVAAISVKGVPSFTVAEALWNVQQALNA